MRKTYSLDDISIVPRLKSTLSSRSEVDLTVKVKDKTELVVPIIGSPMDTICNADMAIALNNIGAVGIIHRFQSIEAQCSELDKAMNSGNNKFDYDNVGIAVGVNGDYKDRLDQLIGIFAKNNEKFETPTKLWICFDTANGFSSIVEDAITWFTKEYGFYIPDDMIIMTGNVASYEGVKFLNDLGVDVVRVGISGGRMCQTGDVSGIFFPMASLLDEIRNGKIVDLEDDNISRDILICADGGIKNTGDVIKCFAMGSDLVMLGSALAGFDESASAYYDSDGNTLTKITPSNGKTQFCYSVDPISLGRNYSESNIVYKKLRGSASDSVAEISNSLNNIHKNRMPEGIETMVEYQGSVVPFLEKDMFGIKSGFSYIDAHNMKEFKEYFEMEDTLIFISENALNDKKPKY